MRNSLKAVVFGAISIVFSASLQAEVHQHEMMSAASDATNIPLRTRLSFSTKALFAAIVCARMTLRTRTRRVMKRSPLSYSLGSSKLV